MNMYGYAFYRRNSGCRLLYSLTGFDYRCLIFGEKSLHTFINRLITDQPDYVIGFGVYGGRDQDKLRIETVCRNTFGRKPVIEGGPPELLMKPFIHPTLNLKNAKWMGNSWCNRSSYEITNQKARGQLSSAFTFIHVPKKITEGHIYDLQSQIDSLLQGEFVIPAEGVL
ncbi:hypothetical protein HGA91_05060 [candidate division WWE3 bacterium]|nr:hypothetical protein [candidate division WWE3 bacterium]